jgi:hypothetical protein
MRYNTRIRLRDVEVHEIFDCEKCHAGLSPTLASSQTLIDDLPEVKGMLTATGFC